MPVSSCSHAEIAQASSAPTSTSLLTFEVGQDEALTEDVVEPAVQRQRELVFGDGAPLTGPFGGDAVGRDPGAPGDAHHPLDRPGPGQVAITASSVSSIPIAGTHWCSGGTAAAAMTGAVRLAPIANCTPRSTQACASAPAK
jgi:hypothetical protein